MDTYKEMYLVMADAIEVCVETMINAKLKAEEIYISQGEEDESNMKICYDAMADISDKIVRLSDYMGGDLDRKQSQV